MAAVTHVVVNHLPNDIWSRLASFSSLLAAVASLSAVVIASRSLHHARVAVDASERSAVAVESSVALSLESMRFTVERTLLDNLSKCFETHASIRRHINDWDRTWRSNDPLSKPEQASQILWENYFEFDQLIQELRLIGEPAADCRRMVTLIRNSIGFMASWLLHTPRQSKDRDGQITQWESGLWQSLVTFLGDNLQVDMKQRIQHDPESAMVVWKFLMKSNSDTSIQLKLESLERPIREYAKSYFRSVGSTR